MLNARATSRAGRARKGQLVVVAAVLVAIPALSCAAAASSLRPHRQKTVASILAEIGGRCPWASKRAEHELTDNELASYVVTKMTLGQKASFAVLHRGEGYENVDIGIPSLCIPTLTLQDGPNGLATGLRGVTALPASLGIAASFDPSLAYAYGQLLGNEARGKGIDVVQAPNLNLLRVPESGRAFEGYGEDPFLDSEMGVSEVEGIQDEHVIADAKHFTAYNQETARVVLDEEVARRALMELYLAPFRAVVQQGHVASIMCSYGALNGVNDCSNHFLYSVLRAWGFRGFVRSDLGSVMRAAPAFNAGMDLLKPGDPGLLLRDIAEHKLHVAALNRAVSTVLSVMFRYHLIGTRHDQDPAAKVTSRRHARFALRAAEQSMVLLKDDDDVLPLSSTTSVAVIGADAQRDIEYEGSGSASVVTPFLSRPLEAIRARSKHSVAYATSAPTKTSLPSIPRSYYVAGEPLRTVAPDRSRTSRTGLSPKQRKLFSTASAPLSKPPWRTWKATIAVPASGLYDFSLRDKGDTWFTINGHAVMSFRGRQLRNTWSATYHLSSDAVYHLELRYLGLGPLAPRLGMEDVTPLIEHAVAVARRAKVALVFANDVTGEGYDRPDLLLPGDENALIEAVARANSHTVVVLNTGGAVLMPWIDDVAAVLEAWYPGEQDGAATAAVLYGSVDPSGRLPLTFPAANNALPEQTPSEWPGTDGTVHYDEGLDIGYRYDEVHHITPLFCFGYGLSYTSFSLSKAKLSKRASRDVVSIGVDNTGKEEGTEVVEAYLAYPRSSGEPPLQLRAFASVSLAPGEQKTVHLDLYRRDFLAYLHGHFEGPPGRFRLWIGTSLEHLTGELGLNAPS